MNGQFPRQGPVPPGQVGPFKVPLLGQQQAQEQTQQAQARAGILQAVQQLSLQIYVQLATEHLGTRDGSLQESDHKQRLQQLARESHLAAKAYFEGLGMVSFEPKPPPPESDAQ